MNRVSLSWKLPLPPTTTSRDMLETFISAEIAFHTVVVVWCEWLPRLQLQLDLHNQRATGQAETALMGPWCSTICQLRTWCSKSSWNSRSFDKHQANPVKQLQSVWPVLFSFVCKMAVSKLLLLRKKEVVRAKRYVASLPRHINPRRKALKAVEFWSKDAKC